MSTRRRGCVSLSLDPVTAGFSPVTAARSLYPPRVAYNRSALQMRASAPRDTSASLTAAVSGPRHSASGATVHTSVLVFDLPKRRVGGNRKSSVTGVVREFLLFRTRGRFCEAEAESEAVWPPKPRAKHNLVKDVI